MDAQTALTSGGFEQLQRAHLRPWLAALIDGEGCITMSKHRQRAGRGPAYRVTVIVSNTNPQILEAIRQVTNLGSVAQSRPERGNWRRQYEWRTTGCGQARAILHLVQPWLIAKRRQAEIGLRACALLTPGNRWKYPDREFLERLKQGIHRLNARGTNATRTVDILDLTPMADLQEELF